MKRLYRSRRNQMIGGVCAGLASFLDTDVTLVRIIMAVSALFGGSGLLFYFIAWFIIPGEPQEGVQDIEVSGSPDKASDINVRFIGISIMVVGIFLLLRNVFPSLFFRHYIWPVALVVLGLVLIYGGLRGGKQ